MPRGTKKVEEVKEESTKVKKTSSKKTTSVLKPKLATKRETTKAAKAKTEAKKTAPKVKKTTTKVAKEKVAKPKEEKTTKTAARTTKSVAKKAEPTKAATKETTTAAKKTTKKTATVKKTTATKKATTKTATRKTSTATKKSTKKTVKAKKDSLENIPEYYDLPYTYNQTIVKILAQTPDTLFVYWDIAEKDRENLIKTYGENFFNVTKPVLIVHNKTKNYSFEIEINDFANSWYFNVSDAKCKYEIELGRRPINSEVNIPNDYIQISYSNNIEAPNDHILFENAQDTIFFKNTKTNYTYSKNIANLEFIRRLGRAYKIFEIYKKMYKDEDLRKINNPSSDFLNKGEI